MIEIQIINDHHVIICDEESGVALVMQGEVLDITLREIVEDFRG